MSNLNSSFFNFKLGKQILLLYLLVFSEIGLAEQQFTTPSCLRSNTDFWRKILTEYGEDQIVIHDSRTFEVFKVIELKDAAAEANRSKLIRDAIDHLNEQDDEEDARTFRAQTGIKEKFEAGRARSKAYLPEIKQIFKEMGVPERIAYLPHVESSFQRLARSRVGARGMWQIMPGTARMYGVRKLHKLHDPIYATRVAGRILKDNYQRLGSWDLAVNAYHSGLGNLLRGKAQAGSTDICKIFEEYKGRSFRFASRNYLGQFYAVLEILYGEDHKSIAENDTPSKKGEDITPSKPSKQKDKSKISNNKSKNNKKITKPGKVKQQNKITKNKKPKQEKKIRSKTNKQPKKESLKNRAETKPVASEFKIERVPDSKKSKGSFDDFN